jgi:hypothetical protein
MYGQTPFENIGNKKSHCRRAQPWTPLPFMTRIWAEVQLKPQRSHPAIDHVLDPCHGEKICEQSVFKKEESSGQHSTKVVTTK